MGYATSKRWNCVEKINMEYFIHPTSINQIVNQSKKEPVLILKHSLTCPISAGAYMKMTQGLEKGLIPYLTYIVIVQEDRELSKEIAETFNIKHESPQLILIKDGEVLYDTSHGNIQVENIPKIKKI